MPLVPADLLERENIINESVEKAAKTSRFFKDSYKILDKKKKKSPLNITRRALWTKSIRLRISVYNSPNIPQIKFFVFVLVLLKFFSSVQGLLPVLLI